MLHTNNHFLNEYEFETSSFKVTKHTKKVVWKVKDFPKLKKVPLEPLKAIKSAQEEDAISGAGVPWWLEKKAVLKVFFL